MKIAVFGAGAMGQLVCTLAANEGHEVPVVVSSKDGSRSADDLAEQLKNCDVAIDFSVGAAVVSNVTACCIAGVPLVEGTTGWTNSETEVRRLVSEHDGALVYGANFSIGVNLFYRIVARAGELFKEFDNYSPFIEEAHHMRKRDAPSGTALRLKDLLKDLGEIPTSSTRAGYIPGTHIVCFDSVGDQVTLKHEARSRAGFAAGALQAANWIKDRKGVYEFSQVIDELLNS